MLKVARKKSNRMGNAPAKRAADRTAAKRAEALIEDWQRTDVGLYDLADALARLRDGKGMSQREIAQMTGRSEGVVSKILSILELDPAVQKIARTDKSGRLTRRHLYALRDLPFPEQRKLVRRVVREGMITEQLEDLAARRAEVLTGRKSRRARAVRQRFRTSEATITVDFRKRNVTTQDILQAIKELRERISDAIATR